MDEQGQRTQRRPYAPPTVARVVIDLIQEMLQGCSTTEGGKQDTSEFGPCTRFGAS